jgi:hypothetical protein
LIFFFILHWLFRFSLDGYQNEFITSSMINTVGRISRPQRYTNANE